MAIILLGRPRRREVLAALTLLSIFWMLASLCQYSPSMELKSHGRMSLKNNRSHHAMRDFWERATDSMHTYDTEIKLPADIVTVQDISPSFVDDVDIDRQKPSESPEQAF